MKRKKYIYTNRRHSERAIMGTILGLISLVSIAAAVILSYRSGGEIPTGYGVTGVLAAVYSIVGLLLGVVTVHDKAYFMIFPVLAICLNLAVLAALVVLVNMGL